MTSSTVTATADGSSADRVEARRASAYAARHYLWNNDRSKSRFRGCGRVIRTGEAVEVRVSVEGGKRTAGFAGLSTCGSVWCCPVCSRKIQSVRQQEIEQALRAWVGGDGVPFVGRRIVLATFTVQHSRGDSLDSLFDAVAAGCKAMLGGRGWKADQELLGSPMPRVVKSGQRKGETVVERRIPMIRLFEVTQSTANGWHVHVHMLLLVGPEGYDKGAVKMLGRRMHTRWAAAVGKLGFDSLGTPIRDKHTGKMVTPGYDVRLLEGDPCAAIGEYFTKSVYSASYELARSDLKDARMGNRTPFSILRQLVETTSSGDLGEHGTAEDAELWLEWEKGSHGRRQIAWSPGLRAYLLPKADEEKTDQEITEEAPGGDVVAEIGRPTWAEIARDRADYRVLAAFGVSNTAGLVLVAEYDRRALLSEENRARSRSKWKRRT